MAISLPCPRAVRVIVATFVAVVIIISFHVFSGSRFNSLIPTTPHIQRPSSESCNSAPVNWSRFAYVQYVTNSAYLCNSVMLFETLHRLGSKADRLIMYPSNFDTNGDSSEAKLLHKARDNYNVKLAPIEVQRRSGGDATWAESFTKLLAFNQTQYARVLSLDSDSTVLQPMDELFLLPPSPVAMPRAYWLDFNDRTLSSQLLLVEPSNFEFRRVIEKVETSSTTDYDMEIVNYLYKDSALIIPHRKYDLLTGEFRSKNHTDYLGNPVEPWDPQRIFDEAKFLHFSDWPVPKPWIDAQESLVAEMQPSCDFNPKTGQEDDCRARDLWLWFYSDFKKRRKEVCDSDTQVESHLDRRALSPRPYEPIF